MDVHGRELRYFVAVAEELHFTRAAERLYVSQPALSKQIRALELQLGVVLFERDRRDVRLTDAGRVLVDHARAVLAAWDGAEAAIDEWRAARTGTLTVGMSTSPGRDGLLPAVRSRFTAERPDMTLALRQLGWEDPSAGLADGSSDVAYLWLPLPDEERYRWVVVAEEPLVVAMADGHRFAALDAVDVDDLLPEPLLALPEEAGAMRDHWLLVDQRGGEPPVVGAVVRSADETYEGLVGGTGLVVLAAGNVPLLLRGGVVVRPLVGVPRTRLALAWRAGDERSGVRAYVDACRQVVDARSG